MSAALPMVCALLIWPLYLSTGLVLYGCGLLLVPIAVLCGAYQEQYTVFGKFQTCFTWAIMAPYQNFEDGIAGPPNFMSNSSLLLRVLMWTCQRNPVDGLRWLVPFSLLINSDKVRYIGSLGPQGVLHPLAYEFKKPLWYFCWHGPFRSCLCWQFRLPLSTKLWRFWIGNAKLYPADSQTYEYGYRQYGTDGVLQLKAVQPGNNNN